jgi:hypothetical protein
MYVKDGEETNKIPTKEQLFEAAKIALSEGLSPVIATDSKRPLGEWKTYQDRFPTHEELSTKLSDNRAKALGIVCGPISGGLTVIDIDLKYDLTGTLYERLCKEIGEELLNRLRIVRTRSGGYHLYVRSEVILPNQKLAQRPATKQEQQDNPNVKVFVLIETRAEGGFVVAPPSAGYSVVNDVPIPVLSVEEFESLFTICRSFNEVIEEKVDRSFVPHVNASVYAVSSWQDYDNRGDVVALLEAHGWAVVGSEGERILLKRPGNSTAEKSGDFHTGKRLFKVFTTSTQFDAEHGYKPSKVFALLECNGDAAAAAKKLGELGYGQKFTPNTTRLSKKVKDLKATGKSKEDIINTLSTDEGISVEKATQELEIIEATHGEIIAAFWDVDKNGKITINRTRLTHFISYSLGFYQIKLGSSYQLIREQNRKVEIASVEEIKKAIKDYIEALPERFDGGLTSADLMEVILKGADTYFAKSFLDFITTIELDLLKDTKDAMFFPFTNGIAVVTADGIELKSYKEVNKHIWSSHVINAEVEILDDYNPLEVEYMKFLECTNGNDLERIQYAITIIGYLLHNYKNRARAYAVILAEETEDERKGGGTGKGIFTKAIAKLRKVTTIDGKEYKSDKGFKWQRVEPDTRIIAMEDVRKNVDFEGFYPAITEGLTIERKNKAEIFLDFDESPKLLFTTNYTIAANSNHAERRQKVLEFSDFFSPQRTPEQHFGHQLFNDWERDEWNRFYNLMFQCSQEYLKHGILEVIKSDKIKRKQIKQGYTEEFLEWFDHYSGNGCADWKMFSDLYTDFLNTNELEKKEYSVKRFRKALEESASLFEWKLETQRNRQNNNKHEYRLIKPA